MINSLFIGGCESTEVHAVDIGTTAENLDFGLPNDSLQDAHHPLPDSEVGTWTDPFHLSDLPARGSDTPFWLSQVGLYAEMSSQTFNPHAKRFKPKYPLWSDGTEKTRWILLPEDGVIDTANMNHWHFPVGTRFFKTFSRDGQPLETRLIVRTGEGSRDYWMGAFLWNADGSDALFVEDGATNVLGTDHDVPEVKACGTCHNGEPGRALGFNAIQLSHSLDGINLARLAAEGSLSEPGVDSIQVPGDTLTSSVLGYLHANCGHCHNPRGSAWPDTDIELTLDVADQSPEQTKIYQTTLDVELQYFNAEPNVVRVKPGDPALSAVVLRMRQRGLETQMPPLATKHIDEDALSLVENWIQALTNTAVSTEAPPR